jgi:hypothetical protein
VESFECCLQTFSLFKKIGRHLPVIIKPLIFQLQDFELGFHQTFIYSPEGKVLIKQLYSCGKPDRARQKWVDIVDVVA